MYITIAAIEKYEGKNMIESDSSDRGEMLINGAQIIGGSNEISDREKRI